MSLLRRRQRMAAEECARLQHERAGRQEARDARAAAIRQAEAGRAQREAERVRRTAEHQVRQEHRAAVAVNAGAQLAAINERLAVNEAKLAAVFEAMDEAVAASGISPSKPSGHLRLVDGGGERAPRESHPRRRFRLITKGHE